MPVVPRIEMPPITPSRAFSVLRERSNPSGTEMTTETPRRSLRSVSNSRTTPSIMARGTGFIAAEPTSRPRPGLVTLPTPTPPSSFIPGVASQQTVEQSSAPWVTSGSSPASLMTLAVTLPSLACSQEWTAKVACTPIGSVIMTVAGACPLHKASSAARVAAVAQAPVV